MCFFLKSMNFGLVFPSLTEDLLSRFLPQDVHPPPTHTHQFFPYFPWALGQGAGGYEIDSLPFGRAVSSQPSLRAAQP